MRLGDCHVAPVVADVLRARKRAGFRKSRRTPGNEGIRLVVAEPRKDGVLAGEIVIQTNIKFPFIESSSWNIRVVETGPRSDSFDWQRIQGHHLLCDGVY